MPLKADLHEPGRRIQDLTPYEHLRRLFRLCSNHYYRNIKSSAVPEEVKHLMRSLLCIKHDDWEGTVAAIEEKGGKTGSGAQFLLHPVINLTHSRLAQRQAQCPFRLPSHMLGA